ncbi:DUF4312 family protein [Brevibacillus nitrificans]|uniref:DUF4312 family protein n=1 Tax=Brevibacillus nitrificans TaxID=651560 RepID=UPI0026300499|nr:DUF4312 family protein [Brevibacillus nitrificans]MED1796220.1 DUF4312 family protein [Brevibacillus nitrificans]
MYTETTQTLRLSGSADTKEGAFNKIFSQIKHVVARQTNDLVVRIEPIGLQVISATETVRQERLFGLFFPRKRTRYDITVDMQVRLGVVQVENISFHQQTEQTADAWQLVRQR